MNFALALKYITADNLLKVLAILAGAVASIHQIKQFRANSRSSLKADLEILRMLDKAEPEHNLVKAHTTQLINQLYSPRAGKRFKIYNLEDFLMGLFGAVGLTFWTAHILRNGFSFWALLTGVFALASFLVMLDGFDPKKKKA
jgi:hypothetical protein